MVHNLRNPAYLLVLRELCRGARIDEIGQIETSLRTVGVGFGGRLRGNALPQIESGGLIADRCSRPAALAGSAGEVSRRCTKP